MAQPGPSLSPTLLQVIRPTLSLPESAGAVAVDRVARLGAAGQGAGVRRRLGPGRRFREPLRPG